MGYWKSKVLPKIKKIFDKSALKRSAAAAEATKSFDDSKDEVSKQFEERKTELQPKVLELYDGLPAEIKALIKEPKEADLKKNSTALVKFLEDLAHIDFPGSKAVSEACSNSGPALVSGPVIFIFDKVSTLIHGEEKVAEAVAAEAEAEGEAEAAEGVANTAESEETTTHKQGEVEKAEVEEKEDHCPNAGSDGQGDGGAAPTEHGKPADQHPKPLTTSSS